MNIEEALERVIYHHTDGWEETGKTGYDQNIDHHSDEKLGCAKHTIRNLEDQEESKNIDLALKNLPTFSNRYIFGSSFEIREATKILEIEAPFGFGRPDLVARITQILEKNLI